MRGRVHSGQVGYSTLMQRDGQLVTFTFKPTANVESPVNLTHLSTLSESETMETGIEPLFVLLTATVLFSLQILNYQLIYDVLFSFQKCSYWNDSV